MAEISEVLIDTIQEAVKPITIEVDGREYLSQSVYLPPPEVMPGAISVKTLAALIDFIASADKEELAKFRAVQVVDYKSVDLLGHLEGRGNQRPTYLKAVIPYLSTYQGGKWLDQESFIIWLQSDFVQDETARKLLKLAGNIVSEAVQTSKDDGVTQTVMAKKGVVLVDQEELPNPVELQPFRTFPEIEQPKVRFVFRVDCQPGQAPKLSLTETSDIRWMSETAARVKAFLAKSIKDVPVLG